MENKEKEERKKTQSSVFLDDPFLGSQKNNVQVKSI